MALPLIAHVNVVVVVILIDIFLELPLIIFYLFIRIGETIYIYLNVCIYVCMYM